jgi:hypothetical protein
MAQAAMLAECQLLTCTSARLVANNLDKMPRLIDEAVELERYY